MPEASSPNEHHKTITPAEAGVIALTAIGGEGQHTAAQMVERLDGGSPYYLITIGEPDSTNAIAAVDAATGLLMISARLATPLTKPHVMTMQQAIRRAGLTEESAQAKLVWKPSRASLSLLYPLWQVTHGTLSVYIDRDGKVWHDLSPSSPG